MHHLIELQFNEIKVSFEQSMNLVQLNFKRSLFKELRGFVSKNAMDLISRRSNQAEHIGLDKNAFNCTLRSTRGLPCAYEISEYIVTDRPIPLSVVHPHWRKILWFHQMMFLLS